MTTTTTTTTTTTAISRETRPRAPRGVAVPRARGASHRSATTIIARASNRDYRRAIRERAFDADADDGDFFAGAFRELARFERDVDARLERASRAPAASSSYEREQSGVERASDGSMTHRYYVSERVVTYGGRAPPHASSSVFGAGGALASACWLAVGAAWAVATRKFLLGYDATTFKADKATKIKLAAQWPALYATSGKFRKEFHAAVDADRADGKAAPNARELIDTDDGDATDHAPDART